MKNMNMKNMTESCFPKVRRLAVAVRALSASGLMAVSTISAWGGGAAYENPLTIETDDDVTLADWLNANGKTLSGYDALVKKGGGVLKVDASISAFAGEIVVEAGVYEATCSGAFGSADGQTWAIKNGQVRLTPSGNTDWQNETFNLSGTGPDGSGALRINSSATYNTTWIGSLNLVGDATWVTHDSARGSARTTRPITLNGWTLTVPTSVQLYGAACVVTGPGQIVSSKEFHLEGGVTFAEGDGKGTLRIGNYGAIKFVNFSGTGTWDLQMGPYAYFQMHSGSALWTGDVSLEGETRLNKDGTLTLVGKVTGPGHFMSEYGANTLVLQNGANDFTGGVRLKAGRTLDLACDGALPRDGAPLSMTGEGDTLHLQGLASFSLPDLSIDSAGTTRVWGGKGSWKSTLTKNGVGTNLYASAVGAATLDLKAGALQFNGPAGLFAAERLAESAYGAAELPTPQSLVDRPSVAYAAVSGAREAFIYTGFVWNRTPTNETWTFAKAFTDAATLRIDDEVVLANGTYNAFKTASREMTPGPHKFDVRFRGGNGGAKPTSPGTLNNPTWVSNFGFAYDRQGRGSADASCYSAMVDTDGSLFTLVTNTTETTPFYPAFDTMRFGADTKIILSAGAEFTVNDLEGFPTFERGDVKVTGTWTVDAKTMTEAAQAVFGGKVTFAPGAKLVVAHADDRAAFRPNGAFLSIASEDGIDGLPVVEAAGKAQWLFVKSADGRTCTLERRPAGLRLILK